MSVETAFRACLVAHAPLVALVGQRVVQNGIGEGAAIPYVVFTTSHDFQRGIDGTLFADQVSITVECWATGAIAADAVADAVTAALATAPAMAGATVIGRANGFDGDLGLDATVLSIDWWA